MRRIYPILTLIALCFAFDMNRPAHLSIMEVIENVKSINTLTYDFIKSERIDGEMLDQHVFIKMQKSPFKVYMKEISPNAGVEILYPYEKEPTKALVSTSGFPWINVKLHPESDLMKRNQHHTLYETGFDYMMSILSHALEKYESRLDEIIEYKGSTVVNGVTCDMYVMHNPKFEFVNYTVEEGETVKSIARKYHLNEYMIIERNDIRSALRTGDMIKIPNDYSARLSIYVDRDKNLPRLMKIYDDKGLFEQYGFENVTLDPNLSADEFKDSYEAYGF